MFICGLAAVVNGTQPAIVQIERERSTQGISPEHHPEAILPIRRAARCPGGFLSPTLALRSDPRAQLCAGLWQE